jgi:hypothetical protein
MKGLNMHNENRSWSSLTYICAFLMGVLLFWSFGKNWLNFESALVVLAGLVGVAVPVLAFGAWNIFHNSRHKEN